MALSNADQTRYQRYRRAQSYILSSILPFFFHFFFQYTLIPKRLLYTVHIFQDAPRHTRRRGDESNYR